MHNYYIFIEVPSTAPLFSENGLNTKNKIRFLGWTKANNSSYACSKVSDKLNVPYDNLKALLVHHDDDGMRMEKHNLS